jgi:Rad3-related DNA helicase
MASYKDFFPVTTTITKPRASQLAIIDRIQKEFEAGAQTILLEAPVGSGKSAIAVTVAKALGSSHIITPRKALQDQYVEDFSQSGFAVMKGRSSYPCHRAPSNRGYSVASVKAQIIEGRPFELDRSEPSCLTRYCGKLKARAPNGADSQTTSDCSYLMAMAHAETSSHTIHNFHSFLFQTKYANRFGARDIIIIDECHDIEPTARGLTQIDFSLPFKITDEIKKELNFSSLNEWVDWLKGYVTSFSESELTDDPNADPDSESQEQITERAAYLSKLNRIAELGEAVKDKYIVSMTSSTHREETKFSFIPKDVSGIIRESLLSYGTKRLLMSGTIYNKRMFCLRNGLDPETTKFLTVPSTFPVENRPIYFKPSMRVDTSHRKWDENFKEVVKVCSEVMEKFDDAKGLIHAPSYQAGYSLEAALDHTGRIMTHNSRDFPLRLREFYEHPEPLVFVSPVCQQGVDFKDDRARFQIILRVPYPNTSDAYMEHLVKEDFPGYNYRAMITFGQQCGRVNRSETDFGATILVDSRFESFLRKNDSWWPKSLKQAIIYK